MHHPTNRQFVEKASQLVAILQNDIKAVKAETNMVLDTPFVYPQRCAHGVKNMMHDLDKIISDSRTPDEPHSASSGAAFAELCRGAAQSLEALAKQGDDAGTTEPLFQLNAEPAVLQTLLAPVSAILSMQTFPKKM